jgi:hypothetical protein
MPLTWPLLGLRFIKIKSNPGCGGFLMKPVVIESPFGVDRLATWNEVIYAMSPSSHFATEIAAPRDDSSEMDSDSSGRAGNLSEDDMWLALVSEMPDSKCN